MKSGWTKLAGENARARIVDVILDHPGQREITSEEIAEKADLHRKSVYSHIGDLEDLGLIEHTRTVGRTKMYKLDQESEVTRSLIELDNALNRANRAGDGR